MLKRREQILRNVCLNGEVKLTEFNSENDHLHLLIKYPPKVQLSQLINALKGVSSRLMKKEYPEVHRYLWNATKQTILTLPLYGNTLHPLHKCRGCKV